MTGMQSTPAPVTAFVDATTDGDTTTIRFDWRSRVFNGESTGVFVLDAALIRSFTIPPER